MPAINLENCFGIGARGARAYTRCQWYSLLRMDSGSPPVKKVGAMNCVMVAPYGSLEGHNFEAEGYAASLAQEIGGWRPDAGPIVVLGAGGGARAIVAGLAWAGAKTIRVLN